MDFKTQNCYLCGFFIHSSLLFHQQNFFDTEIRTNLLNWLSNSPLLLPVTVEPVLASIWSSSISFLAKLDLIALLRVSYLKIFGQLTFLAFRFLENFRVIWVIESCGVLDLFRNLIFGGSNYVWNFFNVSVHLLKT